MNMDFCLAGESFSLSFFLSTQHNSSTEATQFHNHQKGTTMLPSDSQKTSETLLARTRSRLSMYS